MKKKLICFFVLLLSCIPIILPYFNPGFFPTHDGEWAVVRLGDMYRELRDLQFPPRFSGNLNFGYGYPLFNFAYPFPYYIGILFNVLGFGLVDSIKIIFALTVPVSATAMFLLSSKVWKDSYAGFLSALLYLYLPYRFVDLFVRGSIGESLAFALFPIILYSLISINNKINGKYYFVITALSYSALILTHNIMAVLYTPVIFLFLLAFHENNKVTLTRATSVVIGLGLSAYFWLPAIVEKQLIYLARIPIADRNLYFVKFLDLIKPSWGYGTPTASNPFTYQVGWPHILITLIAVIYGLTIYIKRKSLKIELNFKLYFLIIFSLIFIIFMLLKPSKIIWESLPILKEINYPWTLLAIIGFITSLFAGLLAKHKVLRLLALVISSFAIIFFVPYAKPEYHVDRGDIYYLTNEATTTSSREYTPLWVKELPLNRPNEKVVVVKGNALIENVNVKSNKITFNVKAKTESTIRINTIYYPGWKAFINNSETDIKNNNLYGVMELNLPSNINEVRLEFKETTLRLSADFLSIISVILLFITFILYKKLTSFEKE